MESEKNIRKIKSAVKPAGERLHHKTFMRLPEGSPSIKIAGLSSIFQYEENNSMVAETMAEYALSFAEAADENPGEQASVVFMALGRKIQGSENRSPWMD